MIINVAKVDKAQHMFWMLMLNNIYQKLTQI